MASATRKNASGEAVAAVPFGRDLTSQQAADMLNVSGQYLMRLVDEGRIPAGKCRKHRRLRLADVLAFKQKRDNARRSTLRALTGATEAVAGYAAERE